MPIADISVSWAATLIIIRSSSLADGFAISISPEALKSACLFMVWWRISVAIGLSQSLAEGIDVPHPKGQRPGM